VFMIELVEGSPIRIKTATYFYIFVGSSTNYV
jgi:hypothetical protein